MTKLIKSISVAEMLHMRNEEGLSNADIAKRLGISMKTVYAYIGKQPTGMRKPWGSNRKKDELPAKMEQTEVPEMPHKSFKERLEEMEQRHGDLAEKAVGTIKDEEMKQTLMTEMKKTGFQPFEPLPDIDETPTIAQVVESEKDELSKTVRELLSEEFVHHKLKKDRVSGETNKQKDYLSELLAVFGRDVVRDFLKVALYARSFPCGFMPENDMVAALIRLNGGRKHD